MNSEDTAAAIMASTQPQPSTRWTRVPLTPISRTAPIRIAAATPARCSWITGPAAAMRQTSGTCTCSGGTRSKPSVRRLDQRATATTAKGIRE
jgi:hypothetical protein